MTTPDDAGKAKRKKPVKTTARALAECRRLKMPAGLVERRLPHQFRSVDLFGIVDIVGLLPDRLIGIQACGETDFNAHVEKCETARVDPKDPTSPLVLPLWLRTGARFEIWSFRKTRPRGTKLVRWTCRKFRATDVVEGGARQWLDVLEC